MDAINHVAEIGLLPLNNVFLIFEQNYDSLQITCEP